MRQRRQQIRVLRLALAMMMGILFLAPTSQAAETINVGYLHTLAVDGQFWIAMEKGYFQEQGLEMKPLVFTSGVPLMQALAGGSVDVPIMGAVISNFPTQGIGKVFLLNDIEYDTARLFVRPESGVKTISDLKGKKVATVKGSTARILSKNGIGISVGTSSIDSTPDGSSTMTPSLQTFAITVWTKWATGSNATA